MENIILKFNNLNVKSVLPKEDKEYIVKVINDNKQFYKDNFELNSIIINYILEHPKAEHLRYECKYPEISDEYNHYNYELAQGCSNTIREYFEKKYIITAKWIEKGINNLTNVENYQEDDKNYLDKLDADKIFTIVTSGLNGCTFNELQMNQLKKRMYGYAHNTYNFEKHWELKNKTLIIKNFVSISSYSYRDNYQDKFKDIFIALTRIFTNIDDFSMITLYKEILSNYPFTKYDTTYLPDKYEVDDDYLSYFQIFNNGNLRISFKSELHAKKFVKEFLENDIQE